jgi:hypothetical protein
MSELEVLREVMEKLEEHKFVLELREGQASLFSRVFSQSFYVDDQMVRDAIGQQGMFGLLLNSTVPCLTPTI